MRKLKEVLRLHSLGLSQHQIARSCSISQSTVHEYVSAAQAGGVSWPLPDNWDEQQLEQSLFPQRFDFGPILSQRSIKAMTEILVSRFSEFADLDAYLNGSLILHVTGTFQRGTASFNLIIHENDGFISSLTMTRIEPLF